MRSKKGNTGGGEWHAPQTLGSSTHQESRPGGVPYSRRAAPAAGGHSSFGSKVPAFAGSPSVSRGAGVRPSMARVGDDNALCETFFAVLECELLDGQRLRTQGE